MLHLTVASAALKNRAKSIEKPLDLNETRSKRPTKLRRERLVSLPTGNPRPSTRKISEGEKDHPSVCVMPASELSQATTIRRP
jgi:hypothetical protein